MKPWEPIAVKLTPYITMVTEVVYHDAILQTDIIERY